MAPLPRRRGSGSQRVRARIEAQWPDEEERAAIEADPTPYNPLERLNLARSVEATLLQQPCHRLPLPGIFNGAGLYAIYYAGNHKPYRPISSDDCRVPIYVGKADPAGARKGLADPAATAGPVLYKRIAQHTESIIAAKNLDVADFRARFLVVADIFIGLGEHLLIQQYRPLWNVYVQGFGLHDPGAGRHGSKRSEWDEVHPGRPWYSKMAQAQKPQDIEARVRAAFKSGEAATVEHMASTSPPVETVNVPLPEAPEA